MSHSSYSIQESAADGEYVSVEIPQYFERGYFSLSFFDASKNHVTPTSANVVITVSDDGRNYGTIENGTISNFPNHDRPHYSGSIRNFKVAVSGVVGADSFHVRLAVYN